jgi:thiol-disulfide isomerase/thioredoxin
MYDVLPAPATHAELIKTDPVASLSVIPAMVGSEAVDQLIAMGDAHAYVAETDKVHRINFTTEEGPAYFLIAASEPPVLNQIVMGEGTPIVTTYDFKWAGAPAPEVFTYTAPAEAKKVENIQAEIQKLQSGEGETPSAALVGKPAPAVKLNNLQGEVVDIASHRGKDVVVLDFWATWCGPCRKLMPTLEKVATDYKEKGVVVYAVNQEEAPEEVKKFVADMKVGLNVLLDADGAVSASYMAMSIPQTVVIDKAGNVSKVHVGLTPEYEAEMRQHLDGLLAPATP